MRSVAKRHSSVGFAPLLAIALLFLAPGCDSRGAAPVSEVTASQADSKTPVDTGPQDDAAIRAVIASYLASVSHPEPPKFDPESVAPDVLAVWSEGKTHEGREAFLSALEEGIAEISSVFESLDVKPEGLVVRRTGQMAWAFARVFMTGILKEGRADFRRTTQSTFVLEKRNDRWQIVHELSSRLPE